MKLNNRPSRRTRSLLSVVPGLLLLASPLPAADLGSAGPVPYGTRVVVSGLKGPNAIVLSPQGGLLVAEPAADGRPAAISMVDLATDALTLLFNGPDLPADPLLARLVSGAGGEVTSIATSAKGDLFWTASGEGVIWGQPAGGTAAILLQGLEQPTGIALDPSGMSEESLMPSDVARHLGAAFIEWRDSTR